ncbi:hypothetical protein VKT23_002578 [Stygiomarasmius scandens]|uniref:DUF6535 domain-containing protein n=1 Tax=Marasmiellus scandens TaxID=2682957 RepID=A0ABR1K6G5_9AGAR
MTFLPRLKKLLTPARLVKGVEDPEKPDITPTRHNLNAWSDDETAKPFKPTVDDEACSKLWKVYIDQAKEYDENVLQEWKQDMETLLIFSALYSASLTAFVIESYKTLQDDPAQISVDILLQISRQLNGTTSAFQPPSNFKPPTSSLVCNIFWFLSLAFALMCSLLATFVQQWTRDHVRKTTIKPSPVRRARIVAYLHMGIKDFGMRNFVDAIPILLHISLFLFFGGLVAFLLPVNRPLTYVMAAVLGAFFALYITLTLLPLRYLNSPYRTPLSSVLWRFGNLFNRFLNRAHKLAHRKKTLVPAVLEKSVQESAERDKRDRKAIDYTMRALADDEELLPFIEAIPDALYYSDNPWLGAALRNKNFKIFVPLLESADPDVNILSRISQFMDRSSRGMNQQLRARFSSSCPRALWLLACGSMDLSTGKSRLHPGYRRFIQPMMSISHSHLFSYIQNFSVLSFGRDMCSALAVLRLSWLYSMRSTIDLLEKLLGTGDLPTPYMLSNQDLHSGFKRATETLNDIPDDYLSFFDSVGGVPSSLQGLVQLVQQECTISEVIPRIKKLRPLISRLKDDELWRPMQLSFLQAYLSDSLRAVEATKELPLEFARTCKVLYPSELSLEFNDNETTSDLFDACFPLLHLKQLVEGKELNATTDKLMMQCLKIFISATGLPYNREQVAECRQFVQWYIIARDNHEAQADGWVEFDRDHLHRVGECILGDIRYRPGQSAVNLKAAFLLLCNSSPSGYLLRIESDILQKLFVYLCDAPLNTTFKQTEGYAFFKALLDLVVCTRLAPVHRGSFSQDRVGASLCQDYLLPHAPYLNSIGPDSCRDTLVVAIISHHTDLACESIVPFECRRALDTLRYQQWSNACVHETSQYLFANSVRKLVDTIAKRTSRLENLVLTLYDVMLFFRWRWSSRAESEVSWLWITSRPAAMIISDAVLRYHEPENVLLSDAYRRTKVDAKVAKDKLLEYCQHLLSMQSDAETLNTVTLDEQG